MNTDVAAPWLAIMNQRHPLGRRRQRQSVNKQMIAHQEGVLHRARGNNEVLSQKRKYEESNHKHRADAGHGLKWSFFGNFRIPGRDIDWSTIPGSCGALSHQYIQGFWGVPNFMVQLRS
jgi:hypothetical protein